MSFEAALATLITDSQRLEPEALAARFDLTAAEVRLLRAIPGDQLALAGNEVRTKRWHRFRSIAPLATGLLEQLDHGRTRQAFLAQTSGSAVSPGKPDWRAKELAVLLDWARRRLPAGMPPALVELIAFEHRKAGLAAMASRSPTPATPDMPLMLAAGADYLKCDYDILRCAQSHDVTTWFALEPSPCTVLLVTTPDDNLDVFRLSATVGAILERCDGRSSAHDIATRLRITDLAARERLVGAIGELIALHALSGAA